MTGRLGLTEEPSQTVHTPARGLSGEYAIIWPQLAVVVTDGVVGAAGTGLAATAGQVWHELSQYPA